MNTITLYNAAVTAQYDDNRAPVSGTIAITPLANLPDAESCVVTEELNGIYELTMVYVATGVSATDIEADRILGVQVPMLNSVYENFFRIYRVERDLTGRMYVYARHVSGDLSYIPVRNNTQGSGARFTYMDPWVLALRTYALDAFPFEIVDEGEAHLNNPYHMGFKSVSSASSYIGGEELSSPDKSMIELFGGEIFWDQFTLRRFNARGTERDTPLYYGVNMDGININDDLDGVYTSFILFYADDEIQVTSEVYSTTYAALFPYSRTAMIDWTEFLSGNEYTQAQIIQYLNEAAETYTRNHNEEGNPVRQVEVDVVEAGIEEIYLGDFVPVVFTRHGVSVNGRMKVVAYEWDVLMQRYNTLTLGAIKESLAKTIAAGLETEGLAQNISARLTNISSTMDNELANITQRLTSVEGLADTNAASITNLNTSKVGIDIVSNSNGTGYKFSNGLLICVKTTTATAAIQTAWGSMYYNNTMPSLGNWPVAFNAVPNVSITLVNSAADAIGISLKNMTASSVGQVYMYRPVSTASLTYRFAIIGVGRWK